MSLASSCHRFRNDFDRRPNAGHRGRCHACAVWARQVEALAEARCDLRLPEPLAERLRSLAAPAVGGAVAPTPILPLPDLPLPAALYRELLRIPELERSRRPPPWVARGRYALAASYLLALLWSSTVGASPAALARPAEVLSAGVSETWNRAEDEGIRGWENLREWLVVAREGLQDALDGAAERARSWTFEPTFDRTDVPINPITTEAQRLAH